MTTVAQRLDTPAPAGPADRLPVVARLAGYAPFLLTLLVIVPVMRYYGVGYGDLAKFGAYTLLGNTLPGTLIWRAVRGHPGYLPMDVAFGTTMGFAVELPVYLVCREVGVPVAVVAWPIVTILLFLAVPRLRRYWRGNGQRLPLGVSWFTAAAFLFVLASISISAFRWNALTGPSASAMNVDFPFQFALVGEFKHHVPLNTPWLTDSALVYHWYVYAHGAAASWLTGVEPQVLIMRLLPLPMVGAFLVVLPALVHRLTRRWWPGVVAVLLTLVGVAVSPFAWTDRPSYTGIITDNLWISPTQTYAALYFAAVVYVFAGILRAEGAERRRPIPWVVLAFLLGALAGAKATFMPMVVCGLLLAVLLRLLFRRSVGAEAVALGIALFWLAFAQFVLYRSGSQGVVVDPLQTIKWTPIGQAVMGLQTARNQWTPMLALTAVSIISLVFGWVGMVGLVRREWRTNPVIHLMLGFAAAGSGLLWILVHPGLSQTYFARSASPYLEILSAIGLSSLLPAGRKLPRRFVALAVGGSVLTAGALVAVQQTLGRDAPKAQFGVWSLHHALRPYEVFGVLVVVLVAAALVVAWRLRFARPYALGLAVIMVLVTTVTTGLAVGAKPLWTALASGHSQRLQIAEATPRAMPPGAIKASRWLRDHSDPLDVVATNSHCRQDMAGCDSRDFWLAAFSERQILIEGWSYTETSLEQGPIWDGILAHTVFWNQPLLAANDAIFYRPTAADVAGFTAAHHVKWLVAVEHVQDPTVIRKTHKLTANPELSRYATERFHSGDVTIYQVDPGA
jgi:hypothetical protein